MVRLISLMPDYNGGTMADNKGQYDPREDRYYEGMKIQATKKVKQKGGAKVEAKKAVPKQKMQVTVKKRKK